MSLSGIEAVLGDVVAQQEVVHRVLEGHGELEALPVLRVALVLVLDVQRDGLAVDVLDRRHVDRHRRSSPRPSTSRSASAPACARRRIPCSCTLSRISAQPAVFITETLSPCFL